MPIHLPPVSRRRFLAGTIAAGAGLLLPRALAANPPVDADYWALISDIHISADPAKVARKVNMTDNFKAVVDEVLALPQRPASVLVCGDCAFNSGEESDYAAIKKLLQPLRENQLPLCLTLGNHDVRERFLRALLADETKKNSPPVTGHQVALIKTKRVNWLVLDSLEKTLVTPGLLGDEQLDWLAKTLDANADKPALIVAHHNVKLTQPVDADKMALRDSEKLMAILRPRKQVKAYLHGHTHVWNVKQDESGIHIINLPPTAYVFAEGKPSGWVRAHLQDNGLKLELRCLDHAHKAHGEVVELKWRAA